MYPIEPIYTTLSAPFANFAITLTELVPDVPVPWLIYSLKYSLKTGFFPISLDYWLSDRRFGLQQVLLAVISGSNTASESETGRELRNSQNNCAAFYRTDAN
jgi:hypothetical protein